MVLDVNEVASEVLVQTTYVSVAFVCSINLDDCGCTPGAQITTVWPIQLYIFGVAIRRNFEAQKQNAHNHWQNHQVSPQP